jgi:hypothetical protein
VKYLRITSLKKLIDFIKLMAFAGLFSGVLTLITGYSAGRFHLHTVPRSDSIYSFAGAVLFFFVSFVFKKLLL